jgi:hypothetical protein
MIKLLLVISIVISLSACGKIDRSIAAFTGDATKSCIEGVTYLQFTSGATVQLDTNGKPVACK